MLIKIDFRALAQVKGQRRGIGVTLFINWLFIRHLFAAWLPAEQIDSYIAGMVLLAAAPCIGMVFVWRRLCKVDLYFGLSQAALNDAIMIVALLLCLSAVTVPWDTLNASVALYIVIPVELPVMLRVVGVVNRLQHWYERAGTAASRGQ